MITGKGMARAMAAVLKTGMRMRPGTSKRCECPLCGGGMTAERNDAGRISGRCEACGWEALE